ncbi:MAG: Ig-like domain-containing protein [Oscillospiraceae bacterium]
MKQNHTKIRAAACILAALMSFSGASAFAAAYITTTTVINLNSAPVAENIELTTYRSVSVGDNFRSLDPEGDTVTYSVSQEPKKGTVKVDGDTFTYTPADGKKGKDSFTYVAVDSAGNISNEATVTIHIKKQSTDVSYSDMTESPVWYAATELAERGIFVGEQVGGQYLFNPDTTVTRGEFLVMCMRVCGDEPLSDITRTGFYDDEDIPMWQKPYVTTALIGDIIGGRTLSDGVIVFSPNDGITFAEATVMLNNTLNITDVSVSAESSDAAPVWASQASANLASCNIVTSDKSGAWASVMTRADAAKMLLGAIEVMDARDGGSLLDWAQ